MATREGVRNAKRIEAYRLRLIQDRWLCSVILTVHLEIEAVLAEALRRKLPEPKRLFHARALSFSHNLSFCEALGVLDAQLAAGIRAVNRLRNELAHRLTGVPTVDSLAKFIAAMSVMHPLTYRRRKGKTKELRTFQQIRNHFLTIDAAEVEHFVFVSLILLKVKVEGLVVESDQV
jgi:hypothetical protein